MTLKSTKNLVPENNLVQHPAIDAWKRLHPERKVPQRIQILDRSGPSRIVLRLVGVGDTGSDVIAKRMLQNIAKIECTIYEEILPNVPLPMLNYYGSVKDEESGYYWLFLEDISGEKYHPDIKEHTVAAGKWFGIMNTSVLNIPAAAHLPKRGPEHYFRLLNVGRNTILSNLSNPYLKPADLLLLESTVAHCDHLSSNWDQFASLCQGMPTTLVHGDFITKNVGVRSNQDGIMLLPFDWEKAGWGSPAEDISRIDITTYWNTVKDFWPEIGLKSFKRLAHVGKVFRCLIYLDWIAPQISEKSIDLPMHHLRRCENWLNDLIQSANLWN